MAQYKAFKLTQPSADAAVELRIPTYIQPGITMGAWELLAIEFTIDPDALSQWDIADCAFTLQLMKRSLGQSIERITTYGDGDLIATQNIVGIATATATETAFVMVDATRIYEMPIGTLVYSDGLYVQLITEGTGVANSVWGKVVYQPTTLTSAQAMALIAAQP